VEIVGEIKDFENPDGVPLQVLDAQTKEVNRLHPKPQHATRYTLGPKLLVRKAASPRRTVRYFPVSKP